VLGLTCWPRPSFRRLPAKVSAFLKAGVPSTASRPRVRWGSLPANFGLASPSRCPGWSIAHGSASAFGYRNRCAPALTSQSTSERLGRCNPRGFWPFVERRTQRPYGFYNR